MTNTINYQTPKPQFDMGRVFNRTFGAIKNNFVSFFLTSLIIIGLPMFLIGLMPIFLQTGGMFEGDAVSQSYVVSFATMSILTLIALIVGSVILQGALIFGAVEDFNGRKASLKECLSVALRYFFPLIGMGILIVLGSMLGLLLLVIPGLLIALGWTIAAPILIVEGKGVTDSLSRSWELTQGYKRWILLFMIILTVLGAIIGAVISIFTSLAGDPTTVMLEGASPTYYILNALFSSIAQALSTMINAIGIAAIYYEIRQIKEGIGAESLTAIFD